MIRTLPVLLLIFLTYEAYGFNLKRCREGNPPKEGEVILEKNLLVNITGTFTSSTEYVSSTGNCAAIGSVEEKRELFYAYNLKFIQHDIARGGGENLNAFLSLFDCSGLQTEILSKKLQLKFSQFSKEELFISSLSGCG